MRSFRQWIFVLVSTVMLMGCRSEKDDLEVPTSDTRDPMASVRPVNYLAQARRMLQLGDYDSAAMAANKALVQNPENADAKLIACQAEAARGNHDAAVQLAASIDMQSRCGKQAIDIQYQQLLELGRHAEAADLILQAIGIYEDVPAWRRQAWKLLNRLGRREHASKQADYLCRLGETNERELLSLVRRNDAFPFSLDSGDEPGIHFEPGLGMARWYFTQGEHRLGLQELQQEYESGFATPEAAALYGRLLAETQRYEEIPAWYARCDKQVREHSDFWSALGTYFFDHHQFEASARSLLEAIYRDPSDDFTAHRLAKVFDALGRSDDAEQFRNAGVLLFQTEQAADKLIVSADDSSAREQLTGNLLRLARPFEALQWSLSTVPDSAVAKRRALQSKRVELAQDRSMLHAAAITSQYGVDRDQFSLHPAIDSLEQASPPAATKGATSVRPLAVPSLVNIAPQVGLDFQWFQDVENNLASIPIHEFMGGGIAVLDYDLDGWPDVYLAQGSGDPPTDACTRSNLLFRNLEMQFDAVTSLAGTADFNYSTGIAAGDVNQDGFPDLYLGALGRNRLLINNGDGTFRDATAQLGQCDDRFTTSLAIADINGDALPDLYEAVYIEMEGGFKLPDVGPDGRPILPTPLKHFPEADRWFENLGDGSFGPQDLGDDVAAPGTSLGLIVADFDGQGGNEIFVANDARPNHFLVQAKDGRFDNAADVKGVASGFSGEANACMGIAAGDFNRDGTLDLHVTNFIRESSNQYLQTGGGGFTDFAARYEITKLSEPFVGFGAKAIDFDRNGWLDLLITNGHVFDLRHDGEPLQMPPQLLFNYGDRFRPVSVVDPSGYWDREYVGRSIATADFDRDGSMDVLVGHLDQPLALLHNRTGWPEDGVPRDPLQTGNWIQFELVGTASERDAIGARVTLTMGNEQLVAWVTAGDGYFCSDQAIIDVGLGQDREIQTAEVVWPSGRQQTFVSPRPGRCYLVVEGEAEIYPRIKHRATTTWNRR